MLDVNVEVCAISDSLAPKSPRVSEGWRGKSIRGHVKRTKDGGEARNNTFIDVLPRSVMRMVEMTGDGSMREYKGSHELGNAEPICQAVPHLLLHTSISSLSSLRACFGNRPSEFPQR